MNKTFQSHALKRLQRSKITAMIATSPIRPRTTKKRRSHRQTKSRDAFYDSSSGQGDDDVDSISLSSGSGSSEAMRGSGVSIRSGVLPLTELNPVPHNESSERKRKDSNASRITGKEASSTQSETAGSCQRPNSAARRPSKSSSFFDAANFTSVQSFFFPEKSEAEQADKSPPAAEPEKSETNHETTFSYVASWLQSVFLDNFSPASNCVVDDISEVSLTSNNSTPKHEPEGDSHHVGGVPFVIAFPSEFKPKAPTHSEISILGIPLNLSGWNVPTITTGGEKGSAAHPASQTLLDYGRALIRPAVKQINEMLNLKIRSKEKSITGGSEENEISNPLSRDINPSPRRDRTNKDINSNLNHQQDRSPRSYTTDKKLGLRDRSPKSSPSDKKRSRRARFEREGSSQSIQSGRSQHRGRSEEKHGRRPSHNRRHSRKSKSSPNSRHSFVDTSDGSMSSSNESKRRDRSRSHRITTSRHSRRNDLKRRGSGLSTVSRQSVVSTRSRQSVVSTTSRQSRASSRSPRSLYQRRRLSKSQFSPVNKRSSFQRQASSQSIVSRRRLSTQRSAPNASSRRRFSHQRQQSRRSLASVQSMNSPFVARQDYDSETSPPRFSRSSSRKSFSSVGSYLDDATEAAYKKPRDDNGRRTPTSTGSNRRRTLSRRGSRAETDRQRFSLRRQKSAQSCLL